MDYDPDYNMDYDPDYASDQHPYLNPSSSGIHADLQAIKTAALADGATIVDETKWNSEYLVFLALDSWNPEAFYSIYGPIKLDGSNNVEKWYDSSGNGRHLEQTTSGNRPSYDDSTFSQPAIQLGSGKYLESIGTYTLNSITDPGVVFGWVPNNTTGTQRGLYQIIKDSGVVDGEHGTQFVAGFIKTMDIANREKFVGGISLSSQTHKTFATWRDSGANELNFYDDGVDVKNQTLVFVSSNPTAGKIEVGRCHNGTLDNGTSDWVTHLIVLNGADNMDSDISTYDTKIKEHF